MLGVEMGEGASQLEVSRKSTPIRARLLYKSKLLPSSLINIFRSLVLLLFGTERKTPLQIEISFINVNKQTKRQLLLCFQRFLCWQLLKSNQPQTILMPKRHIWGGKFCSLSPICAFGILNSTLN